MSKEHCFYCFDVLKAALEKRQDHYIPKSFTDDSKFPLFELVSHHLVPSSAFQDHRFDPIQLSEFTKLTCGVSLLVDFEKGKDYLDWEVGVHGIWIEFKDHNGRKRTATYLPEVAKEQGWTKVEAIESLLKKGGHQGPFDDEVFEEIVLTRYKSQKDTLTHEEYVAWRSASN
ncbi:AMME syndrome candidate protein 1 protein [Blyttiomyces sp. JEL0837]|nr:AMME syndrome candidate protein 1 protein [Blyttiomyces sp. JEL0837]